MSDLRLTFGDVAMAAIQAIVKGVAAEVAVFGPRGEKKTTLALAAIIGHAQEHANKGFPLPTTWVGAMDTFMSHTEKTMETLKGDHWQGTWTLREDKHRAVFTLNGIEYVHLWLTGVEDQGGIDRLRREMHGLWIDEAAPTSVLVRSLGLNETAWTTGISSLRLKSYRNPAILTTNYPDRSHWTWQRFVEKPHPGSCYFRIPPGENASPEERARTEKALRNRPDLLRRLHAGQPGSVQLGDPVTPGYQEMRHYDRQQTRFPRPPEIHFGFDAWHHPACLPGYAKITMQDGRIKDLQDVRAGDRVASVWGDPPRLLRDGTVIAKRNMGIKPCVTIETRRQSIRLTEDHRVLVVRNRGVGFQRFADGGGRVAELQWVAAGEVTRQDRLVFVSHVPTPERPFSLRKGRTKKGVDVPTRRVTEDMAELFGAWTGDGHYIRNGENLKGISLAAYSTPTGKHWCQLCEDLGLVSMIVSEKGFEYGRVEVHNVGFARAMRAAGFSGGTREKRIPAWVYHLPVPHRLAFLRGFMDSDGSIARRGIPRFTGVNEPLVWDLWALSKTVGLTVTPVRRHTSKTSFVPGVKCFYFSSSDPMWRLIGSTKYADGIKVPPVTSTTTQLGSGLQAERVIRVVRSDVAEQVYDIQVEPWHNFITNGVVVHNCVVGVLTPMGQLQIWWAHAMHNADLLQLARDLLEPWLVVHHLEQVPRVYAGDKTAFTADQSNRQVSAGQRLLERLPGQWRPTPNDPPTLIGAVRDSLGVSLSTGDPRILLCGPEVAELDAALSGGWHLDEHGKAVKVGDAGKHSHVGDAFAHLVTSIFGSLQTSMDLSKWIHQPAYHQPWAGARVGEVSPSPAAAVNRFPGFDAAKWRRQYER